MTTGGKVLRTGGRVMGGVATGLTAASMANPALLPAAGLATAASGLGQVGGNLLVSSGRLQKGAIKGKDPAKQGRRMLKNTGNLITMLPR